MMKELEKVSARVGLAINGKKTKILSNNTGKNISTDDQKIEIVEDYTYLGQVISFKNRTKKEINGRIGITWKKY